MTVALQLRSPHMRRSGCVVLRVFLYNLFTACTWKIAAIVHISEAAET